MTSPKLFVAGECPICAGFGASLFVKEALSDKVFFFCPSCGTAWENPVPSQPYELVPPDKLAPTGLTLPTREDVKGAGFAHLITKEVPYSEWAHVLEEYLRT